MTDEIKPDAIANVPPATGNTNRGRDVATTAQDAPPIHITLEFINETIMDYFQNKMMPTVIDNDVAKSVPVLYGTPERWATIRKDGAVRDPVNSKLQTPLIVLRRSSIKEGQIINPNNKYVYSTLDAGWNRRNAYDQFAVKNNIRPSKQLRHVVIPDYVDLTYDVVMWTEYQTQMDDLIEQTVIEAHEFMGDRNNFKFRVKIDNFEARSELPESADRTIRTEFQMTVHAYLLPERMVRNFKLAAATEKVFSAKRVVAFTETVNDIKKVQG